MNCEENLVCPLLQVVVRIAIPPMSVSAFHQVHSLLSSNVGNFSKEPLSRNHSTNPTALHQSLHIFSTWLSSVEVVYFSRLAAYRNYNQNSSLEEFAKTYQMICEEVKKPEIKYESAFTLLWSERPFGQVHLLWQIVIWLGKRRGDRKVKIMIMTRVVGTGRCPRETTQVDEEQSEDVEDKDKD